MKKSYQIIFLVALVVGSFWGGAWYTQRGADKNHEARREGRILYYVDPMNPAHTSDKPGVAPCGMPLEPVYAEEDPATPGSPKATLPMAPGTVKITPQKQQIIGVQVDTVEVAAETHLIRTLGRVAPDENRVYRLVSTIDGWMQEVNGSTTGSQVQKNQLMAMLEVYKYDFFTWQQQHLVYAGRSQQPGAQRSGVPQFNAPQAQPRQMAQPHQMAQAQAKETEEERAGGEKSALEEPEMEHHQVKQTGATQAQVVQVPATQAPQALSVNDYYANRARLELLNLGVSEAQIEKLERTKQFGRSIEIRSPVTGFVLARNVSPRQWADKGTEFFKIADLSHVWIVADVFAREAHYIRPGVPARVTLPDQGEAFEATVSEVPPQFDATTRTLKVRLEAHNPENLLRPEMFVDVEFEITLPPAITVPSDAVLDSGLRKTVFVDLGNGLFEPRTVETGWRFDDRVEIVKGLLPGERIVISGNFLIDSESRMKLAAAGFYGTPQKDPVCGLEVYPNKVKAAGLASQLEGKTVYFCSEECKAQFEKEHGHHHEMTGAAPHQQVSPSSEKTKMPNAISKDPVCGMILNESKARAKGLTSEHQGKAYYFCSKECQAQFSGAPEHYMTGTGDNESQPSASGHEEHRHD